MLPSLARRRPGGGGGWRDRPPGRDARRRRGGLRLRFTAQARRNCAACTLEFVHICSVPRFLLRVCFVSSQVVFCCLSWGLQLQAADQRDVLI